MMQNMPKYTQHSPGRMSCCQHDITQYILYPPHTHIFQVSHNIYLRRPFLSPHTLSDLNSLQPFLHKTIIPPERHLLLFISDLPLTLHGKCQVSNNRPNCFIPLLILGLTQCLMHSKHSNGFELRNEWPCCHK